MVLASSKAALEGRGVDSYNILHGNDFHPIILSYDKY
jgi:hypothetical protein